MPRRPTPPPPDDRAGCATPSPDGGARCGTSPAEGRAGGPAPQLADVVARLRRAMRRAARASDPGHPLSVAQLELLACLAEHPHARPGQVARRLRLAPNSVTTLVNALVAGGMVARGSGGADRRTVALLLTPAGAAALARWQATNAAIVDAALAALPAAEQRFLLAALPALDGLVGEVDALADRPAPRSARPAPP